LVNLLMWIASILILGLVIVFSPARRVEAKEWDATLQIQPIPAPVLKEFDWDNFNSIYTEDIETVKREEEDMLRKKEEETKRKQENPNEVWWLAKGIHGEAGICDTDEKYRVGTVIMNRVERPDYPNTVRGVISSGEYSCYQNTQWFSEEPTQEEWAIARDIYENGVRVFEENVVFQSKRAYGEVVFVSEWHEYGAKR
ncbi:MAG: cell wall hydrolase, partial [Clostridia bacterium]|nr:cell wall hydrolase [Clostridia bacterium]